LIFSLLIFSLLMIETYDGLQNRLDRLLGCARKQPAAAEN